MVWYYYNHEPLDVMSKFTCSEMYCKVVGGTVGSKYQRFLAENKCNVMQYSTMPLTGTVSGIRGSHSCTACILPRHCSNWHRNRVT